jgi:hypothetical protein
MRYINNYKQTKHLLFIIISRQKINISFNFFKTVKMILKNELLKALINFSEFSFFNLVFNSDSESSALLFNILKIYNFGLVKYANPSFLAI